MRWSLLRWSAMKLVLQKRLMEIGVEGDFRHEQERSFLTTTIVLPNGEFLLTAIDLRCL
jgi:hypothetical protein